MRVLCSYSYEPLFLCLCFLLSPLTCLPACIRRILVDILLSAMSIIDLRLPRSTRATILVKIYVRACINAQDKVQCWPGPAMGTSPNTAIDPAATDRTTAREASSCEDLRGRMKILHGWTEGVPTSLKERHVFCMYVCRGDETRREAAAAWVHGLGKFLLVSKLEPIALTA